MTPIDDELRSALHRAAAGAPDSTHIDARTIEHRAGQLHRRRASIAVGSTVVLAAVAILATTTLGRDAPSKQPLSNGGTAVVTASASPEPSVDPIRSAPSSVDDWGFRGDPAVRDRSLQKFAVTYAKYRTDAADALGSSEYVPIYAGVVANQSGDVISVLVLDQGRMERVATAVLSEGGTQIVADQPVGPTTVLIDALLPADPANIILAITTPGSNQIQYTLDNDTTNIATSDGIAQFGRTLESKGGDVDFVNVRRSTSPAPSPGSKYTPVLDGNDLASRQPGQFRPDSSQPGRLSAPFAAAQWVLTAWQASDTQSMDKYTLLSGRTQLAERDVNQVGSDILGRCQEEDPTSVHCMFTLKTDQHKGWTFIMDGAPSRGYRLRAIGDWIA